MRSLYLPKQKELSLTKIREELITYFRKNGSFPYELRLDKVVPYNDENR